jgi:hypothetical protein
MASDGLDSFIRRRKRTGNAIRPHFILRAPVVAAAAAVEQILPAPRVFLCVLFRGAVPAALPRGVIAVIERR